MAYDVLLKRSAEGELNHLPKAIYTRVIKTLVSLKDNPRPLGIKKLHGRDGYRVRVGSYRILYTVNDPAKQIDVYSIAHRKDVYR